MSARVTAPGGEDWCVRRRTLLWRPRRRMGFDIDAIGMVLGLIALPLLAFEWLLVGLLSLVVAVVRTVLRRPWRFEAVLPGATERRLTWHVTGWRAAGRRADQVRAEIAAGRDPSRDADERAVTAGA